MLAGPTTPLSFAAVGPVSTVMQPHFTQNWSLFAPDPISEERGIAARFECADGSGTDFVDITTPVVKALQADRFFPSRESRLFSNGILERFAEDSVLQELRESENTDALGSPVAQDLRAEEEAGHRSAEAMLARYAVVKGGSECGATPGVSSVRAVQLRYVFHAFPGWSGRHDLSTRGEITYTDSDWVTV